MGPQDRRRRFHSLSAGRELRVVTLVVAALLAGCYRHHELLGSPPDPSSVSHDSGVAAADADAGPARVVIPPGPRLPRMAINGGINCALDLDDEVRCWGGSNPEILEGSFLSIIEEGDGYCGIRPDGSAECWAGYRAARMLASMRGPFTRIVNSWGLCVIRRGNVICQRLEGPRPGTIVETQLLGDFVDLASYEDGICGLRRDGRVDCMGHESQLPDVYVDIDRICSVRADGTLDWSLPHSEDPPPGHHFTAVSVARSGVCGLDEDGAIVCWGSDMLRAWERSGGPPEGGDFVELHVFDDFGCAMRSDNTVACWGYDRTGVTLIPGDFP